MKYLFAHQNIFHLLSKCFGYEKVGVTSNTEWNETTVKTYSQKKGLTPQFNYIACLSLIELLTHKNNNHHHIKKDIDKDIEK